METTGLVALVYNLLWSSGKGLALGLFRSGTTTSRGIPPRRGAKITRLMYTDNGALDVLPSHRLNLLGFVIG
jgi:hypothetical protein